MRAGRGVAGPGGVHAGERVPCVVVGAGLAGCAAAIGLVRAGLPPPLLLERSLPGQPRRICGEFVSAEGAQALAALGVDLRALGAQPTTRLRLVDGTRVVEAALPFTAWGCSRAVLDGTLQQRALDLGVPLRRGQRVTLVPGAAGAPFRLDLGGAQAPLSTAALWLATGKTDLMPLARRPPRAPEALLGLQWHLRLQPAQAAALRGHVEVLLFAEGYAGLQAIEGGRANLCLLHPLPPRAASARGRGDDAGESVGGPALAPAERLLQTLRQLCPHLARRLDGAVFEGPPQAIHRVPYGFLHRPGRGDAPGLWRLGDQAAVIPSFTGDGMAIALHSAARAVQAAAAGQGAGDYHRRLHADLHAQMARARALYRLGRWAPGRAALLALAQARPALLGRLAALTRVSARARAATAG